MSLNTTSGSVAPWKLTIEITVAHLAALVCAAMFRRSIFVVDRARGAAFFGASGRFERRLTFQTMSAGVSVYAAQYIRDGFADNMNTTVSE